MQKVINVLALASFAVSAGVVGAGAYVYLNQEALMAQAQEKVRDSIADALGGSQLGQTLLGGGADPVEGMDESGAVPLPVVPF